MLMSTNTRMTRVASLPLELLIYIAELAATSDVSTAFDLCLVCKAFKTCVLPILYGSVSLPRKERIQRFITCIEAAQSNSSDPTRYTRRLCAHRNAMYHCDWTLSLLQNAPLEHLLLCPRFEKLPEEDDVEGTELWPQPWHIMVLHVSASWMKLRLDLFKHTTHLYLDNGSNPEVVELYTNMPLTHVGMGFWGDSDDPTELMAAVQSLLNMKSIMMVSIHALISGAPLVDFYGGVWRFFANNPDERLIVMPGLARDELIELFESGKTVWDCANDFRHWREIV
jgi:hypothetical protein